MSIPDGVKGAPDRLPPEAAAFDAVEQAFLRTALTYGYQRIRTPVFEHTEVFSRGVGASTDIVNKEMYTFTDRGDRSLTLRPEATAGIMRAALEGGVPKAGGLPLKISWAGECFRAENVQKGRQRMFTQVDVEALGTDDPMVDAELVLLGWEALKAAGCGEVTLLMNNLGDPEDRPGYHEVLNAYLDGVGDLPAEVEERRAINPLRAFDSKAPGMAEVMDAAPLLRDHVNADAKAHYEEVCGLLADAGIPITQDPRLVRGLDYYTRTTFEYQVSTLGAQSAVGGGGRYDGLAEQLGYPDRFPGIGLALGVDRTLLAITDGATPDAAQRVRCFVVPATDDVRPAAFALVTRLRREGITADIGADRRRARAQFKAADRAGADFALVLGPDEVAQQAVTVKDLRSGEQTLVPEAELLAHVR
ncbi:histidine--tRNA ligase [Euzebya rosea]|uniref:histidine--tRNA ligase n=1 Tax=Euzebya rosea TaxID=2052804 RepID=UPI000D3E48B4|nr:histidine--tRNA ligase [Euzebya rosea]